MGGGIQKVSQQIHKRKSRRLQFVFENVDNDVKA